jgi:hypothetical protein
MAYLTDQQAQTLADAIRGNEKAQTNLQRLGKPELIMVLDAIAYGDDHAVEWLRENGHDDWGLFITAIDGDPYAVQGLFDTKNARLAQVAGYVLGEQRQIEYLQKNNLKAWINLAEAVAEQLSEE